jgi:hypothetical protein
VGREAGVDFDSHHGDYRGVKNPSKNEGQSLNDCGVFCRLNLTVRNLLFIDRGKYSRKGKIAIVASIKH